MRGRLALLNRDMHDLVQPRAIPRRINVRRARLHAFVGHDPARLHVYARRLQTQAGDVRHTAQREKDFLRPHPHRLAAVLESHFLLVRHPPRIHQLRPREHIDVLAPEDLFQVARSVRVKLLQHLRAALHQRHAHAEPGEELGKLQRHRAAAQHDDRPWQPLQAQGRVAGQAIQLCKLWQRERRHPRPGGRSRNAPRSTVRPCSTRRCGDRGTRPARG